MDSPAEPSLGQAQDSPNDTTGPPVDDLADARSLDGCQSASDSALYSPSHTDYPGLPSPPEQAREGLQGKDKLHSGEVVEAVFLEGLKALVSHVPDYNRVCEVYFEGRSMSRIERFYHMMELTNRFSNDKQLTTMLLLQSKETHDLTALLLNVLAEKRTIEAENGSLRSEVSVLRESLHDLTVKFHDTQKGVNVIFEAAKDLKQAML